ncbi:MAG TPA: iron ABC transporter permease [Spirochaeta sp.]|nr:iron ABC transporter permease [Spirochaeta sp.]
MMADYIRTHKKTYLLSMLLIPTAAFVISLLLGKYPIAPSELLNALYERVFNLEHSLSEQIYTVIFNIRMPRVLIALTAGAALSVSGAAYQGMFRNPMASPDLLGASAGAAFGAALGILLSLPVIGIQLLSFGFGLAAVLLTYFISTRAKSSSRLLVLILSGILIGTIFSSLVTLIKYLADPMSKLPAITFWLMGSLSAVTADELTMLALITAAGIIPLILLRWRLNVISFEDDEAKALGVNVRLLRIVVIVCSTMMTSAVVSVAGLIGWIGLIIPHIARMLAGPNFNRLLPASIVYGAVFLLAVDDMARCIGSMEIPLGVLTSIIGAPFFIYIMLNTRRGW